MERMPRRVVHGVCCFIFSMPKSVLTLAWIPVITGMQIARWWPMMLVYIPIVYKITRNTINNAKVRSRL